MERRIIRAWCMYDWANSAYPLVISTALFPVYFSLIARDDAQAPLVTFAGVRWESASLYSLVIAASYAINALLVPVLSGIADWSGRKKTFLQVFCTLGAASCIGLAFFDRSHLGIGLACAMLASVGFNGSLVFYNAFLPEIAPPPLHDHISAQGYIYGYLGSSLLLAGALAVIVEPRIFGIEEGGSAAFLHIAPWVFVAVGLWWRGFAQITLRVVPESRSTNPGTLNGAVASGWTNLLRAIKTLRTYPTIALFLASYLAASMGVQSVILLASLFGAQELALPESLLVSIILLVQFVAALGSWLCARLAERLGNVRGLIAIAAVWGAACAAAYWVRTPLHFALLSAVIGLVLGGLQSQMRATFSKLITAFPLHASLFSLYDIAEKLGTTLGMGVFSVAVALSGSLRTGALVLGGGFVLTIALLVAVEHSIRRSEDSAITR
ncbi:MAG: MFS transporter [Candidatus Kapaibacterium sp.]|nr:MAG: MFS transporter [Candidatus Kapabacteria bacterium]